MCVRLARCTGSAMYVHALNWLACCAVPNSTCDQNLPLLKKMEQVFGGAIQASI